MQTRWIRFLASIPVMVAAVFLIACGGDDNADGHMAEPGVVQPKPADATQMNVTLREWSVAPAQPSVRAGKVYFLVENLGPEHPHEMVVIRSEAGPLDLPFENNKVPEAQINVLDEIAEFEPHSSVSLTLELAPGRYLLICNITEEDRAIGSHYKKGMVGILTVE